MKTREELEQAVEDARDAWNVNTHSAADAVWCDLDTAYIALKNYDKETCHSFVSGADDGGVKCKTHPDAPHGFARNASHNAGRYVCECEHWQGENE
jgi:hypothetical protein